MVAVFNALVGFINSIPPCSAINCFPDWLEDLILNVLTYIENLFVL